MSVRRITNGGKKVIGKFPSIKNNRMVWWESQLERDYIYMLEMDPDVISYEEQPLKIRYQLNGELHLYTPDFRVVRKNKRQIVEVKDEETAMSEEYDQLFRRVGPICRREGYEFIVVTDHTIRIQPRLDNIKFIYKYARTSVNSKHQILLYDLFASKESLTLKEIIMEFTAKGFEENTICALIYHGIISVNFLGQINPESEVRMPLALSAGRRKAA